MRDMVDQSDSWSERQAVVDRDAKTTTARESRHVIAIATSLWILGMNPWLCLAAISLGTEILEYGSFP